MVSALLKIVASSNGLKPMLELQPAANTQPAVGSLYGKKSGELLETIVVVNFVLKMMDYTFKMMDFVSKMTNFEVRKPSPRCCCGGGDERRARYRIGKPED